MLARCVGSEQRQWIMNIVAVVCSFPHLAVFDVEQTHLTFVFPLRQNSTLFVTFREQKKKAEVKKPLPKFL